LVAVVLAACGGRRVDLGGRPPGGNTGATGADATDADKNVFLPRQNGATQVLVDDARVYWVTTAENQLAPPASFRSCLKDACESTVVTYYEYPNTFSTGGALTVAIDGENVYWFAPGFNSMPSVVLSCPRAGCGKAPVKVISSLDVESLASDGTLLYWTSWQETSVFACEPANCQATLRALAEVQSAPRSLSVAGGYAYWVAEESLGSSAIRRVVTTAGAPVETLVGGLNQASSLAVREPFVYFANSDSAGQVLRCAVDGCPGPTVVASGRSFPTGVIADDTDVYWIDVGSASSMPDGSIAKCPIGGCGTQATSLASEVSFWRTVDDHLMAVDDRYVYWVAQGVAGDPAGHYGFPDAAIYRLAK
jgi:hypothetical protein